MFARVLITLAIWILPAVCVSLVKGIVAGSRRESDLVFFTVHSLSLSWCPCNLFLLLSRLLPAWTLSRTPSNLLVFLVKLTIVLIAWSPRYVILILESGRILPFRAPSDIVFFLIVLLPWWESNVVFLVKAWWESLVARSLRRWILWMVLLYRLVTPWRFWPWHRRLFLCSPC